MATPGEPAAEAGDLPGAVDLYRRAAERLGWGFRLLDPEYGFLFEIDSGRRRRVMIGGRSALNDSVAARIAGDKHYTALVLERAGIRVPPTERCLKPGAFSSYEDRAGLAPATHFTRRHGFPVVVKPNRGSHGRDVVLASDRAELASAVAAVWERDDLAVVQTPVPLPDLRLDFLDGDYLIGYRRFPIRVAGDGRSTIRQLVGRVDRRFLDPGPWQTAVRAGSWRRQVEAAGWSADTVLPAGTELDLGGTLLNLNTWASGRLLPELPRPWLRLGTAIGDALGLRHFGIDFRGAGLADDPAAASAVEVNASPLLLQICRLGWEEQALAAQTEVLRAALA